MKNIVLGITGGIAAYKSLDVVSKLKKKDINVDVIMTKSSMEFVTPLSFQSLSQNPVITDMFQEPKAWEIAHISLAKKADLLLVCPATANVIGKVANGIADDMLTTTIMATKAKVVFALAMNTNMYNNPIMQGNVEKLKSLGYYFIDSDYGRLACGDLGKGKLRETDFICDEVLRLLDLETNLDEENDLIVENTFLKSKKVTITAGPTIVPIDPVRVLTNRSSGKMGYAIAEEAYKQGAEVTLIAGPTALNDIEGIRTIKIETNEELFNELNKIIAATDVLIMTSAVADYKIKEYSEEKIKKNDGDLELVFERDRDILKSIKKANSNQIFVGFAAESSNHKENAIRKLKEKNLDYIVMNDISGSKVFGKEITELTVFAENLADSFSGNKNDAAKFILSKIK